VRATVFHAAHDVRVETVPDAGLKDQSDALVRVTRAAICGSDLWFYRGVSKWQAGMRTGHEFIGVVEAVGTDVRTVKPGDQVIAPFAFSDGTCEFCQKGLQTSCLHGGYWGGDNDGGQAEAVNVPFADGTLVLFPAELSDRMAAVLPLTDVLPTGHHAAVRAAVRPGGTAVVVGDGAVGLCAVLAAKRIGAGRIIAVGHNPQRLELARRFGATDTFNSHDDDVAGQVVETTAGGAQHVLEAVGAQGSMDLAIQVARPGGTVGFVGVPAEVKGIDVRGLFGRNITLAGGVAPARAYIPELLADVAAGTLDPSPLLDLTVPLEGVPDGYRAMDSREAIKVMVEVS
jgi:threonine dehydrogenase-like Zn-dependent dehydrogenase